MTILTFPTPEPEGKRCKTCGFVMVPTAGEPEKDRCFCCEHTIPLPLAGPAPCPDCEGAGKVAVHLCDDERQCRMRKRLGLDCPVDFACEACLGTGRK